MALKFNHRVVAGTKRARQIGQAKGSRVIAPGTPSTVTREQFEWNHRLLRDKQQTKK